MATVVSLCDECEVTHRQASFWISKGYIPDVNPNGSGFPLSLNEEQSDVFRKLATLVKAGIRPEIAASHANTMQVTNGSIAYSRHTYTPLYEVEVKLVARKYKDQLSSV